MNIGINKGDADSRLLSQIEINILIKQTADEIVKETRGEISFETACAYLRDIKFAQSWTFNDMCHKKVEVTALINDMINTQTEPEPWEDVYPPNTF